MLSQLLLSFTSTQAALHLVGEFDVVERRALRRRVSDLTELGCTDVEIDASKVTYVDCGCLWELARAKRDIEADGRRVTVRAVSRVFGRAALLSGYDELLPASAHRSTGRGRNRLRGEEPDEAGPDGATGDPSDDAPDDAPGDAPGDAEVTEITRFTGSAATPAGRGWRRRPLPSPRPRTS
jgi:anti-anti-sigma factor